MGQPADQLGNTVLHELEDVWREEAWTNELRRRGRHLPDEWEFALMHAERGMRRLVDTIVTTRAASPRREMELHAKHAERLRMLKRLGEAASW